MAIDPIKRQALIDLCNTHADAHNGDLPLVTLEQFFEGNDDLGSIMCNLQPNSTREVREQLEAIRARPDVEGVLVRIYETMEEDDDSWPFAEQVVIFAEAAPDDIQSWFGEDMTPDEVWEIDGELDPAVKPNTGSKAWIAWWD